MFGQKKKHKAPTISTFVGPGTTIKGDIDFSGGMHIEGTVIGSITTGNDVDQSSLLVLSETAMVKGEVKVSSLVINGAVEGDVYAAEQLQLDADARIKGNVYYNRLEMAEGAQVNGNLVFRAGGKPQVEYKADTGTAAKKTPQTVPPNAKTTG